MTRACRATPSWQLKWSCFLTCLCVSVAITNCKVYLSCQVVLPNRCCFRAQSRGASLLPSTCGWIPESATVDFLSAPLAERPSLVPGLNLYLQFVLNKDNNNHTGLYSTFCPFLNWLKNMCHEKKKLTGNNLIRSIKSSGTKGLQF